MLARHSDIRLAMDIYALADQDELAEPLGKLKGVGWGDQADRAVDMIAFHLVPIESGDSIQRLVLIHRLYR